MAKDKSVISSSSKSEDEDASSHPAVPVSEGADAADNKKYADNPDKPDPTSVASVEVTD